MEAIPQPDTYAVLPDEVHQQLWDRIGARLDRGDSLITTGDYLAALSTEYEAITGDPVSATLRGLFHDAVTSFNREHPERFVVHGVQNSVSRAFQSGCDQLDWDVIKMETAGVRSIARFKSRDWVRGFLREVRVSPGMIDENACVRQAVSVATGAAAPPEVHDPGEPVRPAVPAVPLLVEEPEPEPEPQPLEPPSEEAVEAIRDGTISQSEVDARQAEQAESQARLQQREVERAPERVDSLVRQGYLTSEEGESVRRLHEIDRQVQTGEIDEQEASRLRNSLLTKEQRYDLERKVQGAVDQAVRFLQAFESMQRIPATLDEGLRFLIFHKAILDEDRSAAERGHAAQELLENRDMLHQIIEIMDRKDQEIRMISVGLPPYSYVVKRNERIGNLIIEEDFIDDLRELGADDMSDRLHSDDAEVRVRPAADIRCLIAIVNHLIKPTAWRKDVRLLRVQDTIEQFYSDTDDVDEARKQAESFLNRRLRRMFRDLTSEEKEEMEERGTAMIDSIEKQVVAEREAAEAESARTAASVSDTAAADDDSLSEEEMRKGATIGRVEMRVAGQMRRVPRKIMADPEDEARFILAQRNSDTGDLEPVPRRGAVRIVERGNDGMWRLVSG